MVYARQYCHSQKESQPNPGGHFAPEWGISFSGIITGDKKLFIEVKFHSGKSGQGDHDQLANQYEDLCESTSMDRAIIYLTKHRTMPVNDMDTSVDSIRIGIQEVFKENLYWLSWFEIWEFISRKLQVITDLKEELILKDIVDLLNKQELKHFTGFSINEKDISLQTVNNKIFYHE